MTSAALDSGAISGGAARVKGDRQGIAQRREAPLTRAAPPEEFAGRGQLASALS